MKNLIKFYFSLSLVLFLYACPSGSSVSSSDSSNQTNNTNTNPNGHSGSLANSVIFNGFMYTLDKNALITHDLKDPAMPEFTNRLELQNGLETLFAYEDHLYIGSTSSLYIVNLENRAEPKLSSKKTRNEELINACDPVVVKESYAYSTVKIVINRCGIRSSRSALLVYDVSNKENPIEIGMHTLSEPNGLGIASSMLFICDQKLDAVVAYDIADPHNLVRREDLDISMTDPYDIIVKDGKMLVSTPTGFNIYSIQDLEDIYFIGTIKP